MSSSPFSIELHGSDYVIFHKDQIIAAFATIDEAFEAKYDFETRPHISAEEKMPPAIRWAKDNLYASAA